MGPAGWKRWPCGSGSHPTRMCWKISRGVMSHWEEGEGKKYSVPFPAEVVTVSAEDAAPVLPARGSSCAPRPFAGIWGTQTAAPGVWADPGCL